MCEINNAVDRDVGDPESQKSGRGVAGCAVGKDLTAENAELKYERLLEGVDLEKILNLVVGEIQAGRGGKTGDALLNGSVRISGFKNIVRAPKVALVKVLLPRMTVPVHRDKVLSLWVDAKARLSVVVEDVLMRCQPTSSEIEDGWMSDRLEESVRDELIGLPEEFSPEDIGLMMKLLWLRIAEGYAGEMRGLAGGWDRKAMLLMGQVLISLAEMSRIPAAGVNWDEIVDPLTDMVRGLGVQKECQGRLVDKVASDLTRVVDRHAGSLPYFGEREVIWAPGRYFMMRDPEAVALVLGELEVALDEFERLQQPRSGIVEERRRREDIAEAEEFVLPLISKLDALLGEGVEQMKETADDVSLVSDESDKAVAEDDEGVALEERIVELEKELEVERMRQESEYAEMRDVVLQADSRTAHWRAAYQSATAVDDDVEDVIVPELISSMEEALELVEERYGDRLAVKLNSGSDVKSNYYWRPSEIYEALEWVATDFRDFCRSGSGALNPMILREKCNWFYAGGQGVSSVGKYGGWYETTFEGRSIGLQRHIGKGRVQSAKNIIRVAFGYDDVSGKVIVGYVGRHQRNVRG